MGDIARDDDTVELAFPPRFAMGERVLSRSVVRNDGTYNGRDIGEVLVQRGEVGFVRSIGTFLQQFYIYAVDFFDRAMIVGMRGKELVVVEDTEVAAPAGAALSGVQEQA